MYELSDTIVAVSSPALEKRAIVRITGPNTINVCEQIFSPSIPKERSGLIGGSVVVDRELRVDAKLYLFLAPHSYTGCDVAEIHIHTSPSVTEALVGNLLGKGLRMAGPGEFTARAYLNGKIDLAQAEAVNEIITSSNKFQLAAAERLLAGTLAKTTAKIRSALMDCLSLIEAGLDFSGEDIEFITLPEAVRRLEQIENELTQLLSGRYRDESVVDLPVVGIAGAPNAGKSSLLNKLLRTARSIVSEQRKTTRDVLTGLLTLKHCRCVLFDCAGLTQEPNNVLDELAQQAAIEALRKASVVVFCVDVSKEAPTDLSEDISIRKLVERKELIAVATKSDLLREDVLAERIGRLNELFAVNFIATSTKTGSGVELLRETIDGRIIELAFGPAPLPLARGRKGGFSDTLQSGALAVTARHKQAVTEAVEDIDESIGHLKAGNDEVAAMMLRAAYQAISNISAGRLTAEQPPFLPSEEGTGVDEQILERIFSRFCIGK